MAEAKPTKVKKPYQKMVAGEVKKVEPVEKMKAPTAGEEYHAEKKEKESKSYGRVYSGPTPEQEKEKRKKRLAGMNKMRQSMREKRLARRSKMETRQ